MTDVLDVVLRDPAGEVVALRGDLLCFVEHAFTPDAERVARLASRAHRQGTHCRLISGDSTGALAAFVAELGVELPVAGDPDGRLARRVGRWEDATATMRPGWAQVGRDGKVITSGEGDLPRALLVFLGTAESHAATGRPVDPASTRTPPPRLAPPGWMYLALSAGLVVVAGLVFVGSGGRGGHTVANSSAPSSARAGAPPDGATPAEPAKKPGGEGKTRGLVGGGWYAVPPSLAGTLVRYADGAIEVEGAALDKAPMACQEATVAMTAAIRAKGTWQLDHVGSASSKGARVGVRLLDERGVILPNGTVPGGSQVFVANGRMVADWAPFDQVIAKNADTAQVRLCVDNLAGSGVVRVKDVSLSAE